MDALAVQEPPVQRVQLVSPELLVPVDQREQPELEELLEARASPELLDRRVPLGRLDSLDLKVEPVILEHLALLE